LGCARKSLSYRGISCGVGVQKGGKLLGVAGGTYANQKRKVALASDALIFLIRPSWQNGYGN